MSRTRPADAWSRSTRRTRPTHAPGAGPSTTWANPADTSAPTASAPSHATMGRPSTSPNAAHATSATRSNPRHAKAGRHRNDHHAKPWHRTRASEHSWTEKRQEPARGRTPYGPGPLHWNGTARRRRLSEIKGTGTSPHTNGTGYTRDYGRNHNHLISDNPRRPGRGPRPAWWRACPHGTGSTPGRASGRRRTVP